MGSPLSRAAPGFVESLGADEHGKFGKASRRLVARCRQLMVLEWSRALNQAASPGEGEREVGHLISDVDVHPAPDRQTRDTRRKTRRLNALQITTRLEIKHQATKNPEPTVKTMRQRRGLTQRMQKQ